MRVRAGTTKGAVGNQEQGCAWSTTHTRDLAPCSKVQKCMSTSPQQLRDWYKVKVNVRRQQHPVASHLLSRSTSCARPRPFIVRQPSTLQIARGKKDAMQVGNESPSIVLVSMMRAAAPSGRRSVRVFPAGYRWKTPAPPMRTRAAVIGSATTRGWLRCAETAAKEQVTQVHPSGIGEGNG